MTKENIEVQAEDEKQQEESTSEEETQKEIETQEDDQDGEGKKDEGDKKEEPEEKKARPVYTMSVAKAQEEKRRAVEKAVKEAEAKHQKEIERVKQSANYNSAEVDDEIQTFAEAQGLEPKALAGLVSLIQKRSSKDLSKFESIIEQSKVQEEKSKLNAEFDKEIVPLIKQDFPNATPGFIQEVRAQVEGLAFTKRYNTYKAADIYLVNKSKFKPDKSGHTAEGSGSKGNEYVDMENITDEQLHELAEKDPKAYKQIWDHKIRKSSKFLS